MSGTTPNSRELNQAAAHDTGLYDPDRHDNHIVALYDTDEQARAARDILARGNVPDTAIQLVSKSAGTLGEIRQDDGGIWGMIRSMFAGDDDRNHYAHAVGRGHAVLMVTPTPGIDRQKLIRMLEETHPVDFDARLEEWRQSGYDTATPHQDFAQQRTEVMNDPANHQPAVPDSPRTAWRETGTGATRVRSYLTERSTAQPGYTGTGSTRSVAAGSTQPEPAPAQGASTAGAQTSGANART